MNKQPLLVCTISFILGILIQDFLILNLYLCIGFSCLGILLFGLGFIKTSFFDKFKSFSLLVFFLSLGIFAHNINTDNNIKIKSFPKNTPQKISFQLNKKLNSNEKNKRYEVEILSFEQAFPSIISIPKEQKELDYLHIYTAEAYINLVEKPQYDFQFDYQKYLARQNIYHQGYIPQQILSYKKENINFEDQIKQLRLNLLNKIDQSTLATPNKALLKGIILADRSEISQETLNTFSQTGLIHILAISGSHMAIIFLLILFFLKPIFPVKYRNIPIYLSLIAIWGFAIFINYGNSVVRSCIMITTYYIMIFLQRKPNLLHSLALSALIILCWNTQELFNIGFQLSFLAVWGIYWFYKPIINLFGEIKNQILKFTLNTFSLSFAAQLAVTPLTIYYFHQFSAMSVFINVISIAISQLFIIFSFILCILFGVNLTPNWLLQVYDICASFFLKMVAFFSKWDFSFQGNISLDFPEIALLFIFIYLLRGVFIKPNLKLILNQTYIVLIFVFIRINLNYYYWKKEEILTHQFYKEQIVSVKQNDKVVFFISNKSNIEKIKSFIIKPYLISRRTNHWEIKSLPTNSQIRIRNILYKIQ